MMCSTTSVGIADLGGLFKDLLILGAGVASRGVKNVLKEPGRVGGDDFSVKGYGSNDGTMAGGEKR